MNNTPVSTESLEQAEVEVIETALNDDKLVALNELVTELVGTVSCKEWQE